MLAAFLSWIGKIFASIGAEVIIDVLNTPAKELEVVEVRGDVDLPSTSANELLTEYGM